MNIDHDDLERRRRRLKRLRHDLGRHDFKRGRLGASSSAAASGAPGARRFAWGQFDPNFRLSLLGRSALNRIAAGNRALWSVALGGAAGGGQGGVEPSVDPVAVRNANAGPAIGVSRANLLARTSPAAAAPATSAVAAFLAAVALVVRFPLPFRT